jgi:hypothetical protein
VRHLAKVPAAALAASLLLAGCGGEAESAADLESEHFEELIEAEVEARVEERIESLREAEAAQERAAAPAPAPPAATAPPPPARAEPEPEPVREAPAPEPEPVAIPAGAEIRTVVEADISTRTHEVGSAFRTRVTDDVLAADGLVLVPAGAYLEGRVVEARSSSSSEEEALLELAFEHLVMDGQRVPVWATLAEAELEAAAGDSGARTAAKVATGAAAGAVIGRILGRDTRSTVQGAAAGAVAGAGIALTTRDGHAIIREGSTLVVRMDQPVIVASGR